jgi:hypothetical protein
MLSPLLVTPNTASAEEENVAAASNAFLNNMTRSQVGENIDGDCA